MNELVFLKNEQALTTSLKVAEYFEKRHDRLIQTIEEQYGDLHEFVEMFHKTTYADSYGRRQPMYLMNRDGFFMLVTGFSGSKAKQIKLAFIKQFNAMEAALTERQSEQWREMRGATKEGCKELNAVIHELWLFAKANGCTASEEKFFMNFYKLMNKTLGINPKSRDKLPIWKLFDIDRLQFMAKTVIKGLLAKGEDYHLPYKKCKDAFESYARIAFIPQRLLEG